MPLTAGASPRVASVLAAGLAEAVLELLELELVLLELVLELLALVLVVDTLVVFGQLDASGFSIRVKLPQVRRVPLA